MVVGVAGLTGTLAFTGEAYKLNGGTPYRGKLGFHPGNYTRTVRTH